MLRGLFHLAAGLSTLLLLMSVPLWIMSYWYADGIYLHRPPNIQVVAYSMGGTIDLALSDAWDGDAGTNWHREATPGPLPDYTGADVVALGFTFNYYTTSYSGGVQRLMDVVIPWWFVVLLLAVLPALWLLTRRRGAALPEDACPACGYDLRGSRAPSPTGEVRRCPECGVVAPSPELQPAEDPPRP